MTDDDSTVCSEEDDGYVGNDQKVLDDTEKVKKYVKNELFLRVIDVFSPKGLDVGSYLYNDFMKNCKTIVTTLEEDDPLDKKWRGYMKYLWSQLVLNKSYRIWLNVKRSNAYQAVQDKFNSK